MKKKMMKMLAGILLGSLLFTGCGSKTETGNTTAARENEAEAVENSSDKAEESAENTANEAGETTSEEYLTGIYTAELIIKDMGTITFEMDADKAPITVTNFVNLVQDGFYDGLTFHRIINGFMMQGGDPTGTGAGGSDKHIKGEFSLNGVENDQSHTKGAVSMARAQDPNSASSQFFIVHEDSDFLDGQYACFGYVTDGMDIVDEICKNTPVTDNNGSVNPEDRPIIESITIVE